MNIVIHIIMESLYLKNPKSGSENNQEWGTVNVVVSKGQKEEVVQPPEEDDDEEEEVQPPNVPPI